MRWFEKLFKRLEKFLSVEDISIGVDFDNSVISKLTNNTAHKSCVFFCFKNSHVLVAPI